MSSLVSKIEDELRFHGAVLGVREQAQSFLEMAEVVIGFGRPLSATQDILRGEELYLRRHFLSERSAPRPHVWLHEILRSDDEPHEHDHPWDWSSIILRGGYRERGPAGAGRVNGVRASDVYLTVHAGGVLRRLAEDTHRLELLEAPTWTLFIAGPRRRPWGFQVGATWVEATAYREGGYATR